MFLFWNLPTSEPTRANVQFLFHHRWPLVSHGLTVLQLLKCKNRIARILCEKYELIKFDNFICDVSISILFLKIYLDQLTGFIFISIHMFCVK